VFSLKFISSGILTENCVAFKIYKEDEMLYRIMLLHIRFKKKRDWTTTVKSEGYSVAPSLECGERNWYRSCLISLLVVPGLRWHYRS
jgi:hypothetical protein